MIPWANFDNGLQQGVSGNFQYELDEHVLAWVESGPSMTNHFIDSPMLEIAHERRFVTSQLGEECAGFDIEHSRRMQLCINQLDQHFQYFSSSSNCEPSSPHGSVVRCCWKPEAPLEKISHLSLVVNDDLDDRPASQSSAIPPSLRGSSSNRSGSTPTLYNEHIDIEEDVQSNEDPEELEISLSKLPRAWTTLPLHGARAQKTVRQRKRCDGKPVMDDPRGKKRSSSWVADEDENEEVFAFRRQSLASMRINHITNPGVTTVAESSRSKIS